MVKLVFAVAVFVALLAIQASALRSIITTKIEEEVQSGASSQRCQQQVQQSYFQLQPCRQLIQQSPMTNPWQQQLPQCCQQLRNFDQECACEAVRQIVQEQLQQQPWRQAGQQQMLQQARFLPRMCNVGQDECQFQSPY